MDLLVFDNTDNQTLVSDITTDSSKNNANNTNNITINLTSNILFDIEENISEIRKTIDAELNKLNNDALKDKCKEMSIVGFSKLKKEVLVQLVLAEFDKLVSRLREKKTNDLRNICKKNSIKCYSVSKKENIISNILQHSATILKFKFDLQENIEEISKKEDSKKEDVKQGDTLEQLEKQRQIIDLKMKEEMDKKRKLEEEQKQKKDAEEKKSRRTKNHGKRRIQKEKTIYTKTSETNCLEPLYWR
jgi:translation initiation factor 2B subunit (eIF-2B alpha/beta/delta family)